MAGRRIYTIRKPFMSRKGQFEENKSTLTIGLAEAALKEFKVYRCYIGTNKSVWYEINCADALIWATEHDSWWVSWHTQHRTAILPIYLFKRHKARTKKTMPEPEVVNKEAVQTALF